MSWSIGFTATTQEEARKKLAEYRDPNFHVPPAVVTAMDAILATLTTDALWHLNVQSYGHIGETGIGNAVINISPISAEITKQAV